MHGLYLVLPTAGVSRPGVAVLQQWFYVILDGCVCVCAVRQRDQRYPLRGDRTGSSLLSQPFFQYSQSLPAAHTPQPTVERPLSRSPWSLDRMFVSVSLAPLGWSMPFPDRYSPLLALCIPLPSLLAPETLDQSTAYHTAAFLSSAFGRLFLPPRLTWHNSAFLPSVSSLSIFPSLSLAVAVVGSIDVLARH